MTKSKRNLYITSLFLGFIISMFLCLSISANPKYVHSQKIGQYTIMVENEKIKDGFYEKQEILLWKMANCCLLLSPLGVVFVLTIAVEIDNKYRRDNNIQNS